MLNLTCNYILELDGAFENYWRASSAVFKTELAFSVKKIRYVNFIAAESVILQSMQIFNCWCVAGGFESHLYNIYEWNHWVVFESGIQPHTYTICLSRYSQPIVPVGPPAHSVPEKGGAGRSRGLHCRRLYKFKQSGTQREPKTGSPLTPAHTHTRLSVSTRDAAIVTLFYSFYGRARRFPSIPNKKQMKTIRWDEMKCARSIFLTRLWHCKQTTSAGHHLKVGDAAKPFLTLAHGP